MLSLRLTGLALSGLAVATLYGCGSTEKLPPQANTVDAIEIFDAQNNTLLLQIDNETKIEQVIGYINQLDNSWDTPLLGDADEILELRLTQNGQFVGNFQVGEDFFGRAHRLNWIQSVDESLTQEFSAMLGVDLKRIQIISACDEDQIKQLTSTLQSKDLAEIELSSDQVSALYRSSDTWCQSNIDDVSYRLHYNNEPNQPLTVEKLSERSAYYQIKRKES